MRVAILSDVHANLPALEAVIADAREHSATHLICLGDIVGYGPQPVETLRRIREVSNATVMGNHDAAACGLLSPENFNPFAKMTAERAALALSEEDKAWLRDLPYIIESKSIAGVHGDFCEPESFLYLDSREDAELCFRAMPEHKLLFVGHTHIQCLFVQEEGGNVRKLPPQDLSLRQGCRYVINPGSVGFPRGDKLTADYVLFDTLTRRLLFRSLSYDLVQYRLALVRNGYNPMNYWFLSPSARRRQAELAFLNPTQTSSRAEHATSPFRAHRKPSTRRIFYWMLAFFVLLFVGAVALIIKGKSPYVPTHAVEAVKEEAPEVALDKPSGQIPLPSFANWDSGYTAFASEDGERMTCIAATKRLISPPIALPPGMTELTLTFELEGEEPPPRVHPTTGKKSKPVILESRVLFTRADGSTLQDDLHPYKTAGKKSYTVRVPAGVTALELHYGFKMTAPFSFVMPTLKEKTKD